MENDSTFSITNASIHMIESNDAVLPLGVAHPSYFQWLLILLRCWHLYPSFESQLHFIHLLWMWKKKITSSHCAQIHLLSSTGFQTNTINSRSSEFMFIFLVLIKYTIIQWKLIHSLFSLFYVLLKKQQYFHTNCVNFSWNLIENCFLINRLKLNMVFPLSFSIFSFWAEALNSIKSD